MKSFSVFFISLFFVLFCSQVLCSTLGSECHNIYKCGEEYVCSEDKCSYCNTTSQCSRKYVSMVCQQEEDSPDKKTCVTKPLFGPFMWRDILATILIFVAAIIASGAGLGGGAIFVGVYLLILGFSTRTAVPVSQFTILGGSISAFAMNFKRRHPIDDRPLIDWNVIMVMIPLVFGGTVMGVFGNIFLPDWVVVTLMFLILIYTGTRTTLKSIRLWDKEKREFQEYKKKQKQLEESGGLDEDGNSLINKENEEKTNTESEIGESENDTQQSDERENKTESKDGKWESITDISLKEFYKNKTDQPSQNKQEYQQLNSNQTKDNTINNDTDPNIENENLLTDNQENQNPKTEDDLEDQDEDGLTIEQQKEKQELLEKERKIPYWKIAVCLFNWIFIIIFSLFKGGDGQYSIIGVKKCSSKFWIIIACIYPFIIISTYLVIKYLDKTEKKKIRLKWKFNPGDIRWNRSAFILIPTLSLLTGIIASLIGIGGGLLISAFLVELNCLPPVISATSAAIILFTSSSTSLQYLIIGQLKPEYAAWYFSLSFVAFIIGQLVFVRLVKKLKRTAIIIILIAIITWISCLMIGTSSFLNLSDQQKREKEMGYSIFCNS
ncbi:protein yippee-like [Anaeramoeba flamelloides]|uniref:Protein yippee-like n=1 Tax=Anaeramoeba flamelloides TaxID=1746091 RepID=A0ABQ8ZFZ0_9EUKA|nr:protein yippee-like [Anaeramoeba flamelloides]